MRDIESCRSELNELELKILMPLRTAKDLNKSCIEKTLSLIDDLDQIYQNKREIDKQVVGKLLYLFSSILTEASYAKDPEPILVEAWRIEEKMEKLLGIEF